MKAKTWLAMAAMTILLSLLATPNRATATDPINLPPGKVIGMATTTVTTPFETTAFVFVGSERNGIWKINLSDRRSVQIGVIPEESQLIDIMAVNHENQVYLFALAHTYEGGWLLWYDLSESLYDRRAPDDFMFMKNAYPEKMHWNGNTETVFVTARGESDILYKDHVIFSFGLTKGSFPRPFLEYRSVYNLGGYGSVFVSEDHVFQSVRDLNGERLKVFRLDPEGKLPLELTGKVVLAGKNSDYYHKVINVVTSGENIIIPMVVSPKGTELGKILAGKSRLPSGTRKKLDETIDLKIGGMLAEPIGITKMPGSEIAVWTNQARFDEEGVWYYKYLSGAAFDMESLQAVPSGLDGFKTNRLAVDVEWLDSYGILVLSQGGKGGARIDFLQ